MGGEKREGRGRGKIPVGCNDDGFVGSKSCDCVPHTPSGEGIHT